MSARYAERLDSLWAAATAPRADDAPTIVSTFAGMGGSLTGYLAAGFRELLAVEHDPHAASCLRLNFPGLRVHASDIAGLRAEDLGLAPGELDLLDGSPPCQGFSTLGKQLADDPRSQLFTQFVRLLVCWQPRAFVFENVTGLVRQFPKRFAEVCAALAGAGYRISPVIVPTYAFGAATIRHRLIITGAREDLGIEPGTPEATERRVPTLRDAIRGRPPAHVIDGPPLTAKLMRLALLIQPGSNGGKALEERGGRYAYFTLYRLAWDKPAYTVSSMSNPERNGLLHPSENRLISVGELMRVQGIPDGYQWPAGTTFVQAHNRIGNSVSPLLSYAIGGHIRSHVLGGVPVGT